MKAWGVLVGLIAAMGVALLVLPTAEHARRPIPALRWHGVAAGVVTGIVTQIAVGIPAFTVIAMVAAGLLPRAVERQRRERHLRRRSESWPDLIDHLVSALRAGMAVPSALISLQHSAPSPMQPLVADLAERLRAGTPASSAVEQWRDAMADPIVDRIAMTLNLASAVGGRSLPTVLANLASYLRSEARTRAELVARQSWTVHAARLAVVAPWLMVLILGGRAREAYQTPTGSLILFVGAVASLLGYAWMSSSARLPRESRIFA